jgi:bifunctional DNase/RNase
MFASQKPSDHRGAVAPGVAESWRFESGSGVRVRGVSPRMQEYHMLVQMELARIIISEINDQQIVFLKEVDGPRSFPIVIGMFEATSIDRRIQGNVPPRPLTHDLLKSTITALGGDLQDVVITSLQEHIYYAVIRVRKDGELIEVDCRPSDALALAVHYEPYAEIYVHEDVLGELE